MMKLINATEPNFGVVEDHMIMDSEPVLGKWSISANAHSLVSAAEFINLYSSRKHLRTEVSPDLHLTYSKNGGNLGLVLKR